MNCTAVLPAFHFVERRTKILQDLAICQHGFAVRIHEGNEDWKPIDYRSKMVFTCALGTPPMPAPFFRGAHLTVNVGNDAAPLDDSSVRVGQRAGPKKEPAV